MSDLLNKRYIENKWHFTSNKYFWLIREHVYLRCTGFKSDKSSEPTLSKITTPILEAHSSEVCLDENSNSCKEITYPNIQLIVKANKSLQLQSTGVKRWMTLTVNLHEARIKIKINDRDMWTVFVENYPFDDIFTQTN